MLTWKLKFSKFQKIVFESHFSGKFRMLEHNDRYTGVAEKSPYLMLNVARTDYHTHYQSAIVSVIFASNRCFRKRGRDLDNIQ